MRAVDIVTCNLRIDWSSGVVRVPSKSMFSSQTGQDQAIPARFVCHKVHTTQKPSRLPRCPFWVVTEDAMYMSLLFRAGFQQRWEAAVESLRQTGTTLYDSGRQGVEMQPPNVTGKGMGLKQRQTWQSYNKRLPYMKKTACLPVRALGPLNTSLFQSAPFCYPLEGIQRASGLELVWHIDAKERRAR